MKAAGFTNIIIYLSPIRALLLTTARLFLSHGVLQVWWKGRTEHKYHFA